MKSAISFLLIFVFLFVAAPSFAEILSYDAGNCKFEHYKGPLTCHPGEYAVYDTAIVGPGRYAGTDKPDCANEVPSIDAFREVIEKGAEIAKGNIAGGIRSLLADGSFSRELEKTIGGHNLNELLKILGNSEGVKDAANCYTFITVVPKEATITANAVLGENLDGLMLKCDIGWADKCGKCCQAFPDNPVTIVIGDSKVTKVVYRNWKHDKSRKAMLVTFYTLPEGVSQAPIR